MTITTDGGISLTSGTTFLDSPTLSLDFITESLDSRITFTRGSTATFVGSDGLIQTATTNTPRFEYDPVTLQPKGLLIEDQRTNLLLYSSDLNNSIWAKTRASIIPDAVTAPDGTLTADKLVDDSVNNSHVIAQTRTITSGTSYTFSVYLKAAERTFARVTIGDTGGNNGNFVNINLQEGTISTGTSGTGWTLVAATATNTGSGWWRISITGTNATATSGVCLIYLATGLGTIVFTGDGGSGIYIWGAQMEVGLFATSYIPTVASTVIRSPDLVNISGTNYSDIFNPLEGTIVVTADCVTTTNTTMGLASISDGTGQNLSYLTTQAGAIRARSIKNNITDFITGGISTFNTNIVFKAVLGYKENDYGTSANGSAVSSSNAVSVPNNNRFGIGNTSNFSIYCGHIRTITYYNYKLTNIQIQGLSRI